MKRNILMCLFLLISACGYNNTKTNEGGGGAPGGSETGTGTGLGGSGESKPGVPGGLDFASVRAQVFQPNCFGCHSAARGNKAGLNLETYANVKPKLQKIKSWVDAGDMPPAGPLAASLKDILNNWIAAGAPEVASAAPSPPSGNPPNPPGPPSVPPTVPPTPPPRDPCEDDDHHRFVQVDGDLYFDTQNEILRRGGRCDDDDDHRGGHH